MPYRSQWVTGMMPSALLCVAQTVRARNQQSIEDYWRSALQFLEVFQGAPE